MASFATFGNQLYTGERSFDFIGRRRLWYLIAVISMILAFGALAARGINPGIEFEGGSEFRISRVADTSDLIGQKAVEEVVPGTQARISSLGDDGVRVEIRQLDTQKMEQVKEALAEAYGVPADTNVTTSFVGPRWGKDVSQKAVTGLLVFLVLVSVVITLYFRTWKMAVAGIVGLLHDLVLTVGVYALVGFEVTPASVIGFLTILGYSLYDTVVVFDKVRENTEHISGTTRLTFVEAANLAVNQTLVRSINTSVVALLPVASILFIGSFLMGAGTLKDISLALFVGIAAGTYSSVFIATPLLVHLRQGEPAIKAQAERVRRRRSQDKTQAERVPARVAAGGESVQDTQAPARATTGSGQRRTQPKKKGGPARKKQGGKRR